MKTVKTDESTLMKLAGTALQQVLVSARTQRHLIDIPTRVLRRLEFLFPRTVAEQQAALYWMGNQGDEDDAVLLATIPSSHIICSPTLFESARESLFDRVGHPKFEPQQSTVNEYLITVTKELLPGLLDSLRDLVDTTQVEEGSPEADLQSLTKLGSETDLVLRDLQYLFPTSDREYQATLLALKELGWWTELALLFAVPPENENSNEVKSLHQDAQDNIIDRMLESADSSGFHQLAIFGVTIRPILGYRGSVTIAGERRISKQSANHLLEAIPTFESHRNNLAMVLGEWGGEEEAKALIVRLETLLAEEAASVDFQVHLVSAISNIGGSEVVNALLKATETGAESVRLAALSGLENLGTAASETLTEPSAPAIISIDMKPSYEAMVQRLGAITRQPNTTPYVIYKVGELLDSLRASLRSVK